MLAPDQSDQSGLTDTEALVIPAQAPKIGNFAARLAAHRAGQALPERELVDETSVQFDIPAERRAIAAALAESTEEESTEFRLEVEIKGMPYIFWGSAPSKPTQFEWYVSSPDSVDDPTQTAHLAHRLDNGTVGILSLVRTVPNDQVVSLGIHRIETNTETEGVGSFLLDTIGAYTDLQGWRTYLHPQDMGGGRLTQSNLYGWYRKRGYRDAHELPRESRSGDYGMQRPPHPVPAPEPETTEG